MNGVTVSSKHSIVRGFCLQTGFRTPRLYILLLFWAHLLAQMGLAQLAPQRIEDIRIVGNRRIPEATISYYIQSRVGDVYKEEQIFRDYRSLLNTNFFGDAKVKIQTGETGVIVIFEVKERPLIRAIEYEGMTSLQESDVLEQFREQKVGLSVDAPYDEARIPKARHVLRFLLETSGRPLGRVDVETEPITSSAIKLIFKIDEGPKVRIGEIQFEGNTVFTDRELRNSLELTKERGPITLFKGHDKYIGEKMEYDIQLNLLSKYREQGYLFARAGEPKVAIVEGPQGWLFGFRKTKQQYYVIIPVEEGEQYRYGGFTVTGVRNFNQDFVDNAYGVVLGEVVNYKKLKQTTEDLKKFYSSYGYLDMEAIPSVTPDQKAKTVDVTVQIEEGKQYIVHRINFAGNTKTRDRVLRREFILQEQQMFNGNLLDVSVLKLNQLGFFENIEEKDYEVIKKPDQAEVDILVKVRERTQQSIGLTGGVSGLYGGFIGINYRSNNFRGMGQQLELSFLTGTRTANYILRFTEPYFRDTLMSLGMSVFSQRFRFDTFTAFFGMISPSDNIPLFTRVNTGFDVTAGYPFWRWLRLSLTYSLQTIRISDIDELYEDFALNQLVGFTPGGDRDQARKGILRSEITPSLYYNTKNAYFGATRGSSFTLQTNVAGGPLGGSFNVIRPYMEYQKFVPDEILSGGRNTLAFRVAATHILPFGKLPSGLPMSVPFFERIFFGGEYSLRGFEIRSISPWAITRTVRVDVAGNPFIDPNTGLPLISERLIPVGGDASVLLSAEYRMPIVGPLHMAAFVDFGTSTVLRKSNLVLFGPSSFIDLQDQTNHVWRMSSGAELQFMMPVVNQPFRLIFAYNPIVLDTNIVLGGVKFPMKERQKNIRFTVGYTF